MVYIASSSIKWRMSLMNLLQDINPLEMGRHACSHHPRSCGLCSYILSPPPSLSQPSNEELEHNFWLATEPQYMGSWAKRG